VFSTADEIEAGMSPTIRARRREEWGKERTRFLNPWSVPSLPRRDRPAQGRRSDFDRFLPRSEAARAAEGARDVLAALVRRSALGQNPAQGVGRRLAPPGVVSAPLEQSARVLGARLRASSGKGPRHEASLPWSSPKSSSRRALSPAPQLRSRGVVHQGEELAIVGGAGRYTSFQPSRTTAVEEVVERQ